MIRNRLPVVGVLLGTALTGLATAWYPGGYHWSEDTISALFQGTTPGGIVNPARPLAVMGVFATMSGIAWLFHHLSRQARATYLRRSIQIAGIASTAFAALTVVLLHDLMVSGALVCFVVAITAVLQMLYHQRAAGLFALGVLSLVMELGTAVLYFGRTFPEFLPSGQKAALILTGLWLFAVDHRARRLETPQDAPG